MTSHMTPLLFTSNMAGELRKGERIPRRPLPKFEEAGSFSKALARDGLIGTALDDTNEYGPVAMILILMIVATITGGIILAFRYLW